jgi:tetratricopeptide (TPR) repeat protein
MRASREGQIGTAAEDEASANFVRLNWGVARNRDHDLGTDLWLMPCDERLLDLGLIVGAQVKGGPSRFGRPKYDSERNVVGWWFRVDRRHADYWLSHVAPHLLVLHDLETRTSYWAHITPESVISTGVEAKLLVPASQTVTNDQRDALLAVAASSRPRMDWEGSAWTGAGSLLPRNVLRHALIVPRLVAPHPNTGQLEITAEQAVALLVQARVREVMIAAERYPEVPSLTEARDSSEWSWRFVGALAHRVTTGSIDLLLETALDPPDASSRAASTVAAATALIEEGRSEEALELLSAAIDLDQSQPVDQAWLTVQRARLLADVGRVDEARADAISVQKVRQTHPEDVTATAITGVAAALLFNASAWGQRDIEAVITNTDTAAAWWRTQTMSGGLSALALREFKGWARDRSVTLGGSDEVNDQLFAASLMANLLGDHGTWCFLSGLLGKQALLRLDRGSEVEAVRSSLETLRIAGDEGGLTLAVNRVIANGPADAVTLVATEMNLDRSTHTTGPTNLALLGQGGDVLDVDTADRTVIWLLGALREPTQFAARTNPSYLVEPRLVETLAGVVFAASAGVRRSVVEYLIALPGPIVGILAHSWRRVIDTLPDDDWDEESCLILAKRTDDQLGELRLPLRELAG